MKIVPLRVNLWIKEIKRFLEAPVEISDEEVEFFEKMFSPKECAKEIINLLKIKT